MLLIGKLLIATAVVAGPVAGVFAFTSLGSNSSTSTSKSSEQSSPSNSTKDHSPKSHTENSERDKYTKNNCYEINSVSNNKEKLLTCTGVESSYYFHNTDQKDVFKKVTSMKIDTTTNQLLIVIEDNTKQNKNLTTNGENWQKFPRKNEELINSREIFCSFSSTELQNKQMSWSCTINQPKYESYQLSTLTIFK